jgi:hypothetical protein
MDTPQSPLLALLDQVGEYLATDRVRLPGSLVPGLLDEADRLLGQVLPRSGHSDVRPIPNTEALGHICYRVYPWQSEYWGPGVHTGAHDCPDGGCR